MNSKFKIAMIANNARFFLHFYQPLIEKLINLGIQVDIISTGNYSGGKCSNYYNLDLSRNPLSFKNIGAVNEFNRIINLQNYDLIHSHTPVGGLISRVSRMFSRKKNRVPIIYTAHGLHFFKGAPRLNWIMYYPIEKILSYLTDTIVLINDDDYLAVKDLNFKSRRIELIPGVGINHDVFKRDEDIRLKYRNKLNVKNEEVLLSFVAEFNENKNQILLLKTIKILLDRGYSVKLLLVGDGTNFDYLKSMVHEMSLEDNVLFTGYITNVSDYLNASDIAVSSSKREGLPVNIIESMAMGLPVVATNCRGNNSLVKDGENGYLTTFSADDFAKCLEKIFDDKEIYKRFSSKSLDLSRNFEEKKIISRMIEIYHEVLSEKSQEII